MRTILFKRRRIVSLLLLLLLFGCAVVLWMLSQSSSSNALETETEPEDDDAAAEWGPLTQHPPSAAPWQQAVGGRIEELDPGVFRDRWMRYHPPVQSGIQVLGKPFDFGDYLPKWISEDYVTLTPKSARDFVIATAASAPFYAYTVSALETVQRHLPNHRTIVYDLESLENAEYADKFSQVCGVIYRRFNYSLYPPHVKSLMNYAWKPLIITELLSEFPGVFWIDSSIRFTTGHLNRIFEKVIRSDGLMTLTTSGHSNYAVTHPVTYEFLPTSMAAMVATDQREANCLLLFRTRRAVEGVLWWWKLCALEPLCIAPTTRTICSDPYKARDLWAECHRFDQSALNILLANHFAFDTAKYFGWHRVAKVERHSVSKGRIKLCGGGKTEPSSSSYVDIATYMFKDRYKHLWS